MKSVFTDKKAIPDDTDLQQVLKQTYDLWQAIRNFTIQSFPQAKEEWKHSGERYGWSFRISDKKRVLVYLLPREGFFKVAFVFGQKATDAIVASEVAATIKDQLLEANVYAEGRGIRIELRNDELLNDVKKLINIKLTV